MRRRPALLACFLLCMLAVPTTAGADTTTSSDHVVIRGVGSAHGLGIAMDGALGQARAGWTYDRILSQFYPGTTTRHAGGTIRVGLAQGGTQHFSIPGGGVVTDVRGGTPSAGFPLRVPKGARLTVTATAGKPTVRVDAAAPQQSAAPQPTAAPPSPKLSQAQETEPPGPLPSGPTPAPPSGAPTAPPPPLLTPSPTPSSVPEPTLPPGRNAEGVTSPDHTSLWITPHGDPALVGVDATGKRYRGTMEVRASGGSLQVVNHVDLETYIRGIAEARGAGWPNEAMKTLAVAARSLAAATMTWFDRNRGNGYDICPSANCQVYFGYDGEAPDMARAAAETSGQIRVYNGRPILAMYHGNGGGQTEDYGRAARTKVNAFPYLRSVRYPYADPSHWRRETSYREIAAALGTGPIERIEILERGESPRVIRMRIVDDRGGRELTGTAFMTALQLRSTWFYIGERRSFATLSAPVYPGGNVTSADAPRATGRNPWPAVTGAAALIALAAAAATRARKLPPFLRIALRQSVALMPLRPGP